MRSLATLVVAVIAVLAAVTASASAYTLTIEPGGRVAMPSTGAVTFEAGGGTKVECNLTLSTTLSTSSTRLTAGAQLGSLTGTTWAGCTGGSTVTVLGLPRSIAYEGVSGTLPNAVADLALTIEGFSVNFSIFGGLVNCLYRGTLELVLAVSGSNRYRTGSASLGGELEWVSGTGCPGPVSVSGNVVPATQTLTVGQMAIAPAGEVALVSEGGIAFEGGGIAVVCNLNMGGALSGGPIGLYAGASIGSIRAAEAEGCAGGGPVTVLGLPWPIRYLGVEGTLPNAVTALDVEIEGFAVRFAVFGMLINCLYAGNLTGALEVTGENPYATEQLIVEEATSIPRVSGSLCPASVTVEGALALVGEQAVEFI